MSVLEKDISCIDCDRSSSLERWINNNDSCPNCNSYHIIPRLHLAKKSITERDFEGKGFSEVLESFNLDESGGTNLLILLGVSEEAAIDVERVILQNWPRIDWRRTIGRTRENEERNFQEVRDALDRYGVVIEIPEE